jgi:hypothetical protein
MDELLNRIREGFVPIVRAAPGFKSYSVVRVRGNDVVTISVFENQAQARQSNDLAADWVRENVASFVDGPPEIISGEMAIHETA